jgi:hypothetical protein
MNWLRKLLNPPGVLWSSDSVRLIRTPFNKVRIETRYKRSTKEWGPWMDQDSGAFLKFALEEYWKSIY